MSLFQSPPRSPISIHAPRTGSDMKEQTSLRCRKHFNPRSPHGERHVGEVIKPCEKLFQSTLPARGATSASPLATLTKKFQSTLPARGATFWDKIFYSWLSYFNPRSPHGERRLPRYNDLRHRRISIHAPRTGSDHITRRHHKCEEISIHAPRTGSDGSTESYSILRYEISIHAPRTGSDRCRCCFARAHRISIHAPRTGSDMDKSGCRCFCGYFNPRSPHGERQANEKSTEAKQDFNPRSPHGERR